LVELTAAETEEEEAMNVKQMRRDGHPVVQPQMPLILPPLVDFIVPGEFPVRHYYSI